MTATDILKLIKRIDINKVKGEDQIPPKIIKTDCNFLVEPLTDIKSCFITSTFHDMAKRASVSPIDKAVTDKDTYTNYRPASAF